MLRVAVALVSGNTINACPDGVLGSVIGERAWGAGDQVTICRVRWLRQA